jgi:fibronectin-binding autotransporter adhesin
MEIRSRKLGVSLVLSLCMTVSVGWALGSARAAPGTALTFPGSGACATSLQACINSANDGDSITISAGTYTTSVTLSKAVSLLGAGSSTTILRALTNQRVMTVTAAASNQITLSQLTISGGNVTGDGGGILIARNGPVYIYNVAINSNRATGQGGGMAIAIGSAVLSGTQFIANAASVGGGVFANGDALVFNSLFERNVVSSTSTGWGGGMAVNGALNADSTQFLSNTAGIGAGVYVTGAVTLTNAQFISNTGHQTGCGCGGGVMGLGSVRAVASTFDHNSGSQASGILAGASLTLTDSVFLNNDSIDGAAYMQSGTANVSGGHFENNRSWVGGGLYLANGSGTVSGTQFISNAALYDGGGLFSYVPLTLTNALFISNTATGGNGGGVHAASALTISGTRFLSNTAQSGGGLIQDNLYNQDGRIINSLFAANRASGGVNAAADLDLRSNAYVTILHTTIADSGLNPRPAIAMVTGTVGITDTIITSHTVGIKQTAGALLLNADLFFGNSVSVVLGGSYVISGVVTTDPKFINPAAYDYHLGAGSGAIDSGINAGVLSDIDGDPRPIGAGFDIGYDERLLYVYMPLIVR